MKEVLNELLVVAYGLGLCIITIIIIYTIIIKFNTY